MLYIYVLFLGPPCAYPTPHVHRVEPMCTVLNQCAPLLYNYTGKIKIPSADVPGYQESHGGCKFCGEPFPGYKPKEEPEGEAAAAAAAASGAGRSNSAAADASLRLEAPLSAQPPPLPSRPPPSSAATTGAAAAAGGSAAAAATADGEAESVAAAAAAAKEAKEGQKPRGFVGRISKSFKSAFGW